MKKIIALIAFAAAPFLFGQQKLSESSSQQTSQSVEAKKAEIDKAKAAELEATELKKRETKKATESSTTLDNSKRAKSIKNVDAAPVSEKKKAASLK